MRTADKELYMSGIRVLLTLLVVVLSVPVSAQTTGGVAGCITYSLHHPLPRATVTATAGGTKFTVLADAEGCYQLTALPPNLYRVTVRLLGFDNTTRDNVRVVSGQVQRVDLVTQPSAICECLSRATTLREFFERADAVMYLRITETDKELSAPAGWFRHAAAILEVFKQHDGVPSAGTQTTFLQDQSSGAPEPYESGEEFLLFLNWWPAERIFVVRTTDTPERSDKYTTRYSVPHYGGSPVEVVLTELRKMSKEQ